MPIQKATKGGKTGYRWGSSGKVYTWLEHAGILMLDKALKKELCTIGNMYRRLCAMSKSPAQKEQRTGRVVVGNMPKIDAGGYRSK